MSSNYISPITSELKCSISRAYILHIVSKICKNVFIALSINQAQHLSVAEMDSNIIDTSTAALRNGTGSYELETIPEEERSVNMEQDKATTILYIGNKLLLLYYENILWVGNSKVRCYMQE